jgi:peptidoglycan/xylan/chitin deacetylase (PgdA/CDA1 family)
MKALKAALAGATCAGVICAGLMAGASSAAANDCPNPNAIGVARTVQIDTTGGPGFGMEHYKANDFLQSKEVILTFDDGPQKFTTEAVLAALAEHCTKATFFSIGKMALGYPDIIRNVAKAGHTVGTHTWSHKALRKLKTFEEGRDEIERGVSAVRRAVGGPISPFFRFPTLVDTPQTLEHLGKRNIAMFSTDIDSFDFKIQSPENMVKGVMAKLDKHGKGIVLMHDIHKTTAKALPLLLNALKAGGYKIVHMKPKTEVVTLAEFDAAIDKDAKGLPQPGADRPVSSIVKTIEGDAPEAERAESDAPAAKQPAPAAAPEPAAPAAPPSAPAAPRASIDSLTPDDPSSAIAAEPAQPVRAAEVVIPQTGAIPDRPAVVTEIPAAGAASIENAPGTSEETGPQTLSSRAKEIWQDWFGK